MKTQHSASLQGLLNQVGNLSNDDEYEDLWYNIFNNKSPMTRSIHIDTMDNEPADMVRLGVELAAKAAAIGGTIYTAALDYDVVYLVSNDLQGDIEKLKKQHIK